ncbi:hypothetical protein ACA910_003131 [Epithemia clementina (nom. ined.)]
MTLGRKARKISFRLLLLILPFLKRCNCFPYTILTSTTAKCVQLDVSQELVVSIGYEAPDLGFVDPKFEQDGWSRRESFAGQDMTILVFQRNNEASWTERAKPRDKVTGSGKIRLQIENEKGDIHFYTGNSAGILEICQQSYKATPATPRRLALNITQRAATAQEQLKNTAITDQEEEKIPDKDQTNAILNVETSRISLELGRMEEKLKELVSHSEHSMDMEQDFHKKQVRLNRAVRYWPMFRMAVVIVAGIVQTIWAVNHMRSRHIF